MSNAEKPTTEGASELSGNTYYPPPPPGPPPPQSQTQNPTQTEAQGQQQQQQQQPPPQEQQQEQQKQDASHDVHESQDQKPQTSSSGQYHAQSQQEQPHFPPPPTQHEETQSSHLNSGQQSSYSIPAYNPADPTYAAPAAQTGTGGSHAPSTAPGESSSASPHQQQHADTEHGHKRSSWGGRIKSMLSAGAVAPINSLAHRLGSQSFLPEPLDKECDKAASILRAFCTKGVYADPGSGQPPTSTDPKAKESSSGLIDPTKEKPKNRVIVTIPPKVISKAVGLAVFTTLRAGFQVSGATGSGVLVARLPDGSWSPPSAISVHSLGGGFQIGLDIYDCVCVINSREALSAFSHTRVSLGSDLTVTAGPYGAGGAIDFGTAVQRGRDKSNKQTTTAEASQATHSGPPAAEETQSSTLKPSSGDPKRRSSSSSALKPVYSYVKSRGFYAGIQVDGTVVVERKDANSAFYGAPVTVQQILQGQVPSQGPNNKWPAASRGLMETLKGAEAGALGDRRQPQQTNAGQHESGHQEQSGAIPAPSSSAGNIPANSSSGGNQQPSPESTSVGAQPAGGASGSAPPAYIDDGSHAHVSDVKYA